jgi:hypothetical protein
MSLVVLLVSARGNQTTPRTNHADRDSGMRLHGCVNEAVQILHLWPCNTPFEHASEYNLDIALGSYFVSYNSILVVASRRTSGSILCARLPQTGAGKSNLYLTEHISGTRLGKSCPRTAYFPAFVTTSMPPGFAW